MRYQLKQIYCRPWTLSGFSLKLIESHYENNYGGALRRLNAITEQLESLDFAKAVLSVVPKMRFYPLEVAGCKVASLTHMPFVFGLNR